MQSSVSPWHSPHTQDFQNVKWLGMFRCHWRFAMVNSGSLLFELDTSRRSLLRNTLVGDTSFVAFFFLILFFNVDVLYWQDSLSITLFKVFGLTPVTSSYQFHFIWSYLSSTHNLSRHIADIYISNLRHFRHLCQSTSAGPALAKKVPKEEIKVSKE